MIECCLVVVCFCLLHDTNLGPTLPAGGLSAFDRHYCASLVKTKLLVPPSEFVTQKGVLRLARCKTSATHEGL